MKISKYLGMAVLLMSVAASAATVSGKRTVTLFEPAQVGDHQLAAGTYKVEWTGEEDAVTVTFTDTDKKAVSVTGKMEQLEKAPKKDAALLRANGGTTKKLGALEFDGKKSRLLISDAQNVAGK